MDINFLNILRAIKTSIYPDILNRHDKIILSESNIEDIQRNIEDNLNVKSFTNSKYSEAKALESKSFSSEDFGTLVKEYGVDNNGNISYTINDEGLYSSKHWAKLAETLTKEDLYRAIAARLTSESFATQAYGEPVRVYTSNGNGTFSYNEVEYVFSSLHYMTETEKLSGHRRWVETVESSDGQSVFSFGKNIGNADVYVNEVRQTETVHYEKVLSTITFYTPLIEGDVVVVSGMEAITQDEFKDMLEQTIELEQKALQDSYNSEASRMTARSFASEPVGEHVKIYTSNGDGTYSVEETNLYSTLHWSVTFDLSSNSIPIVDRYDDLKLLNSDNTKVAYVRGGLDIDDGRHGLFDFDPEYSSVNNGGTVINGWVRQYDGPAELTWFGIYGNGENDDTDAIKAALEYCEYIDFGSSRYLVSEELDFSNTRIVSNNATIVSSISTGNAIKVVGVNNINVISGNLNIEFSSRNMDSEKNGIYVDDCSNCIFDISVSYATSQIKLKHSYGDISGNIFNIKNLNDSTISIDIDSQSVDFGTYGNTFNIKSLHMSQKVYDTDYDYERAGAISIVGENVKANTFNIRNIYISNNEESRYKIARLSGYNNELHIDNISSCDFDDNIFIIDSGTGSKIYSDSNRVIISDDESSTIDYSQSTGISTIGSTNTKYIKDNADAIIADREDHSIYMYNSLGRSIKLRTKDDTIPSIGSFDDTYANDTLSRGYKISSNDGRILDLDIEKIYMSYDGYISAITESNILLSHDAYSLFATYAGLYVTDGGTSLKAEKDILSIYDDDYVMSAYKDSVILSFEYYETKTLYDGFITSNSDTGYTSSVRSDKITVENQDGKYSSIENNKISIIDDSNSINVYSEHIDISHENFSSFTSYDRYRIDNSDSQIYFMSLYDRTGIYDGSYYSEIRNNYVGARDSSYESYISNNIVKSYELSTGKYSSLTYDEILIHGDSSDFAAHSDYVSVYDSSYSTLLKSSGIYSSDSESESLYGYESLNMKSTKDDYVLDMNRSSIYLYSTSNKKSFYAKYNKIELSDDDNEIYSYINFGEIGLYNAEDAVELKYNEIYLSNKNEKDSISIKYNKFNISNDDYSIDIIPSAVDMVYGDYSVHMSPEYIDFINGSNPSTKIESGKVTISNDRDIVAYINYDGLHVNNESSSDDYIDVSFTKYIDINITQGGKSPINVKTSTSDAMLNSTFGSSTGKIIESKINDGEVDYILYENGNEFIGGRYIEKNVDGKPSDVSIVGNISYEKNPSYGGYVGYVYIEITTITCDYTVDSDVLTNVSDIGSCSVNDEVVNSNLPDGTYIVSIDVDNNEITVSNISDSDEASSSTTINGWKSFGKIE